VSGNFEIQIVVFVGLGDYHRYQLVMKKVYGIMIYLYDGYPLKNHHRELLYGLFHFCHIYHIFYHVYHIFYHVFQIYLP